MSPASIRLSPALRGRRAVLLSVAAACVVEMWSGAPGLLTTPAGLWLLFGAPTAVWYGTAAKAVSRRDSALLLAVGFAVITDLLVALGVNTVLPWTGIAHPLTRIALGGAGSLVLVVLGALLPEARWPEPVRRPPGLGPVAGLGALCLVLSVAGPIRLNNGLGGSVAMAALVAVTGLLVLLLMRRRRYSAEALQLGLFLAGASLLLMNSLRGWFITGHDIQREYEYFRLTLGGARWDISAYPNPYNACLSITLLPVSVYRLTAIPDIYVFKAVLPLLFAVTPVAVYRSVRNATSQLIALMSAVFFLAFPTFFTDMTFLGRQEVAFVLLGCCAVVLTDARRPLARRRLVFLVLAAGIVLSHYSTSYMVVATLGVSVAADLGWRLASVLAVTLRGRRRRRRTGVQSGPAFVTWWMVAVTAALALVWAGPVTHTSGQLRSTMGTAVQELLHFGQGPSGSSDTSYSLLGGTAVSPQQRMTDYRAQSVQTTVQKRAAGDYLPLSVVGSYPTPVVAQQNMPLTSLGRLLGAVGVDVATLNGLLRQGAATMLQLLLLVGLVVTVRARRRRGFRPTRDQIVLTVGAIGGLVLITLVPQLSVDYSVLRAFQQGLLFFSPFIAAGMLWALRWAGRRTVPLACVVMAALMLDLTGVVPKALGGYPAQLQLSDAGQYYDLYYSDLRERVAASWLMQHIAATGGAGKPGSVVQAESFTFARLQTVLTGPVVGNIYPTVLGTDGYVFLGSTTVRDGQVSISYEGDRITYQYPVDLLDREKNEIYSSDAAAIYK
jgi:uncharacterized membrane protein